MKYLVPQKKGEVLNSSSSFKQLISESCDRMMLGFFPELKSTAIVPEIP